MEVITKSKEKKFKLEYDKTCKRIISNTKVLSKILKTTVPEFKDCSINQIIDCLKKSKKEPNIVKKYISGIKEIRYDLLIECYTPKNKKIRLLINIEAQGYKKTYPIYRRCERYLDYLFISQGKDYENYGKVYSIWIYADTRPHSKSGVYTYFRKEESSKEGQVFEMDENKYQISTYIIINIGKDFLSQEEKIIKYLAALMVVDDKMDLKQRKKILNKDINIYLENKKGVDDMCNLSEYYKESVIQEGIELGIEQGERQGIERSIRILISKGMDKDEAFDLLDVDKKTRKKISNNLSLMN